MEEIVNKVAKSGLITFNLEEFYDETEVVEFDMKDHLFHGLILKEKDFRGFIKENDWQQYAGKHVALFCTADAIVPTWAYMLVANKLSGIAGQVFFGSKTELQQRIIHDKLNAIDVEEYRDRMVVIKGCSKFDVPIGSYVEITNKLSPVVKSIMFGEPCSTVPIYKKPRQR
ncbi:MAG: DUF2480 family protein [Bacteroidia bacterium]|nr:DUF2480 family protein [Bacteroidia bacterium]